eukprot:CAMPEP_0198227372 /NCGR_PEP_ID=MMETSP1445-20131203/108988_1 /TAXON_ID=36898 /ORGANISM="Pyramimonas sp., Strain CCMP2087" /LENGTH=273 /DNA_ID=CAMNT_0043907403 /DNA_START=37 /DNA_END=855 /DNA_ORIENTATION=-
MCKENRPATKNALQEGCPKDAQDENDYEQDETFDLFEAEEEDPEWEPLSILGKSGREVSIYFDPARVWIWDASRILSEWCLDNAAIINGNRVLELGSGLGVPSLVSSLHAAEVLVTDFSQGAIDGLSAAIQQNRLLQPKEPSIYANMKLFTLDWRDVLKGERESPAGYVPSFPLVDIVLGADVIYTLDHPLPLAAAVDAHLRPGGVLILTAKNIRPGISMFFEDLKARNFECVATEAHVGQNDKENYTLWHMRKPHGNVNMAHATWHMAHEEG